MKTQNKLEIAYLTGVALLIIVVMPLCGRISGQEIKGPTQIVPGTLAVFEVTPPQQASWVVTPPNLAANTFSVDSSGSRLYFSTPTNGTFTIVAAIVIEEKKPHQLCATLFNGSGEPDTQPQPEPAPEPETGLAAWIAENLPTLVKSANIDKEKGVIAGCFKRTLESIDQGTIQTAPNARTQLQITITAELAKTSNTAVTDWQPFLAAFGTRLEEELGEQINSLDKIKAVFSQVQKLLEGDIKQPVKKEVKEPVKEEHVQPQKPEVQQQPQEVSTPVEYYYYPTGSSCATGNCPTK